MIVTRFWYLIRCREIDDGSEETTQTIGSGDSGFGFHRDLGDKSILDNGIELARFYHYRIAWPSEGVNKFRGGAELDQILSVESCTVFAFR